MSKECFAAEARTEWRGRTKRSVSQGEERGLKPAELHELRARSITAVLDEPSAGTGLHRVSVVIPALNEAQNLPHVLAGLPAIVAEVIVVDGHSTDGTPDVARRVRPDAQIIEQPGKGKGDALRCGFAAAAGDIVVMMDADGSADPAEIESFIAALLAGADFAKGTRFDGDGGSVDITRVRKLGNRVLSGLVNMLFGTRYSDLCYGYNAFWRHCLPVMNVDCAGFEIETLINIRIARAGLRVQEVPSFEHQRLHGQSNLRTFRDGRRVLATIFRERRRRAAPHPVVAEHAARAELDLAIAGNSA